MKKRCYQRFVGSFEHLRVLRHCIWQTSPGLLLPAALCPPGKRAPLRVFQGKLLGHIAKSLRFSIPIFWQAAQFWKKELMNGSEVLVLHTRKGKLHRHRKDNWITSLFYLPKNRQFCLWAALIYNASSSHPMHDKWNRQEEHRVSPESQRGTRRAPKAAAHCQIHVLRTAQKPHVVTKPIKRGSEKAWKSVSEYKRCCPCIPLCYVTFVTCYVHT